MNYLQPSEYETYGLDATTALAWITASSALIDAHCRRITLSINQYTQRLRTGNGQRPVQLTYLPLSIVAPATSAIVSARGRYAVPRRGEMEYEADLWDVALAFGIPGTWVDMNVADLDTFAETGEVTLPVNIMGWSFTEVEIVYTAGFATFPDPVKVACAQLVKNAQATPALNVKKNVVPDGMQFWYFSDSLVDATVQELLAPFVAQRVG
ncbi:MAG TPA: hypothetical protein VK828_04475 [Terriglobales bacterium]|jgi:hypothetical protein|nr:hypothetical protein [Terriglobales bacterium]